MTIAGRLRVRWETTLSPRVAHAYVSDDVYTHARAAVRGRRKPRSRARGGKRGISVHATTPPFVRRTRRRGRMLRRWSSRHHAVDRPSPPPLPPTVTTPHSPPSPCHTPCFVCYRRELITKYKTARSSTCGVSLLVYSPSAPAVFIGSVPASRALPFASTSSQRQNTPDSSRLGRGRPVPVSKPRRRRVRGGRLASLTGVRRRGGERVISISSPRTHRGRHVAAETKPVG